MQGVFSSGLGIFLTLKLKWWLLSTTKNKMDSHVRRWRWGWWWTWNKEVLSWGCAPVFVDPLCPLYVTELIYISCRCCYTVALGVGVSLYEFAQWGHKENLWFIRQHKPKPRNVWRGQYLKPLYETCSVHNFVTTNTIFTVSDVKRKLSRFNTPVKFYCCPQRVYGKCLLLWTAVLSSPSVS